MMNTEPKKLWPALAFRGVELPLLHEPLDFALHPGELGLVHFENRETIQALLDFAGGLRPPTAGEVAFEGARWAEASPVVAAQQRARIGRVFDEGQAWVSNLNVLENVTLAQRHHTRRPVEDIETEANELARGFGLPELPRTRPAWTSAHDLRRAQWVRALLGAPRLLLLADPTRGAPEEQEVAWCSRLDQARASGAAVLWATSESRLGNKESIRATWELTLSQAVAPAG